MKIKVQDKNIKSKPHEKVGLSQLELCDSEIFFHFPADVLAPIKAQKQINSQLT